MKDSPGNILYKNLLVRNKVANWGLRSINYLFPNKRKRLEITEYRRILVCNNAHLGDVILSTSILNLLKEKYPSAKIDFLCGSWSRDIVLSHPAIDDVITFDHWKLNRSKKSFFSKLLQHYNSYRQAVAEIRTNKYDIAIDLYFFFPNSIFFLWIAGVPLRIGYSSGGFENLLTTSVHWKYQRQSVVFYHLSLIKQFAVLTPKDLEQVKPVLAPASEKIKSRVHSLLAMSSSKYIVIHIGTGLPSKEWPVESWKKLITLLDKKGTLLLFTGYGEREAKMIAEITKNSTSYINLCNQTSLEETSYVIKMAQALVCVDSVAGHIASAWNVPTVIIGNGINDDSMWKPFSSIAKYIVHDVPCMPCYTGCAEMECIKLTSPELVFSSVEKIMSEGESA